MNERSEERTIRVDFFKSNGTWYETETISWTGRSEGGLVLEEFAVALSAHLSGPDGSLRLLEMTAVCLEYPHEHCHPLMLRVVDVPRLAGARGRRDGVPNHAEQLREARHA